MNAKMQNANFGKEILSIEPQKSQIIKNRILYSLPAIFPLLLGFVAFPLIRIGFKVWHLGIESDIKGKLEKEFDREQLGL